MIDSITNLRVVKRALLLRGADTHYSEKYFTTLAIKYAKICEEIRECKMKPYTK